MMCKEIVACCECFASDKVSHHRWKSLRRHWHRVEIGQVLFFPRRNYATSACDCLPHPRISLRRARHFTKQWNVSRVTARAQLASCLPVPSSGIFFASEPSGCCSLARGRRRFRRPFHLIRFLLNSVSSSRGRGISCSPSMAFNSRNLFTVQFQFLVIRLLRFSAVDRSRE